MRVGLIAKVIGRTAQQECVAVDIRQGDESHPEWNSITLLRTVHSSRCMSCLFPGVFTQYFELWFTLSAPISQETWVRRNYPNKPPQYVWAWNVLHQESFSSGIWTVGVQVLAPLWRFVISCGWDHRSGLPGNGSWMLHPLLVLPELSDCWSIKRGPSHGTSFYLHGWSHSSHPCHHPHDGLLAPETEPSKSFLL